jgi:hypothetical protein
MWKNSSHNSGNKETGKTTAVVDGFALQYPAQHDRERALHLQGLLGQRDPAFPIQHCLVRPEQ